MIARRISTRVARAALVGLCGASLLLVSGALASKVTLTWNASSGATSYNIYRSSAPGGEQAPAIGTTTGTSYVDLSPLPGPNYYVATAVNANGESGFSNEAEGTVTAQFLVTGAFKLTGAFSDQYLAPGGGGGGGGSPLTYSARTDVCGSDPTSYVNGVSGTTCGAAGLVLNYQNRTTDVDPFTAKYGAGYGSNGHLKAPMNSTATDPDTHALLVMVTDTDTKNQTNDFTISEWNDATDISAYDGSMFFVGASSGAGPFLYYLYASQCRAGGTCLAASQIIAGTYDGCSVNCSVVDNGYSYTFSRVPTESHILYENAGGIKINRLTFCRLGFPTDAACKTQGGDADPDHFDRALYANYADATNGVLPTDFVVGWKGVFGISNDGSNQMAVAGGGDWHANTAYVTPDSFIWPQSSNTNCSTAGHCYSFQAVTSGTSGGSIAAAFWYDFAQGGATYGCSEHNYDVANSITPVGSVVWAQVGKPTVQGPGYYILRYGSPTANKARGYSMLNTRISKIYRGASEYTPPNAPGTNDPSGPVYTDDGLMCVQFGYASSPPSNGICPTLIPFHAHSTIHDSGAQLNSDFVGWSATGGGGTVPAQTYSPAIDPDCVPTNSDYRGAYVSTQAYTNNQAVFDPANPVKLYVCDGSCPAGTLPGGNWQSNGTSGGPIDCYKRVWNVATAVVNECMTRPTAENRGNEDGCAGHEIHGFLYEWGGNNMSPHLWSRQTINGQANPGGALYPVNPPPGDQHGSGRNENTTDTAPAFSFNTDVPTWTYDSAIAQFGGTGSGYGEITAVKTDQSGVSYRFAHSFNSGSSPAFACQNNIGAVFQNGQWAVVPSDFMGTRGSNVNAGSNASNFHRAMYAPTKNHAFSVGDTVFPPSKPAPVAFVYQAMQAGTSGPNTPDWPNDMPNVGDTMCDPNTGDANGGYNVSCAAGQVQWKNLGANDGRCDMMLVDLVSAH